MSIRPQVELRTWADESSRLASNEQAIVSNMVGNIVGNLVGNLVGNTGR
jgi:hypothetical protein